MGSLPSLKEKTISGVKWQVINKVGQKAISVVAFAILARILEPSVFGLFALAFVMIDGVGLLRTFGIDSGIIQRKDCPEQVLHTAFFMIQITGILVFLFCFFSAPLAAFFFKNAKVGSIIRVLGVVFIMSCLGRVSQAVLVRDMKFKLLSVIEMIGSTMNSIFAVVFAMFFKNVWTLVGAYLIKQLTMSVLTIYFSGYRMKWKFDPSTAKELLHFGKFLTGVSLIWFANNNLGSVVVGKILGTVSLGYLALASTVTGFMNTHFTALISNVLFPAYSTLQHDPEALKRAYLKTNKFVSMINIPFSVATILMAREIVMTVYGEKWMPVIPLMQLTSVANIVVPLMVSTGTIFNGCGKPEYSYRLALLNLVVRIPLIILFTLKWGVTGTITSALVNLAIVTPVYFVFTRKIVRFTFRELFDQFLPSIYCSIVMAVAILAGKQIVRFCSPFLVFHFRELFLLAAFSGIAIVSYIGALFLLDRESTLEMKRMIFKFESA